MRLRGRALLLAAATLLLLLFARNAANAGSATWKTSPSSGDWNTATNWMPTVPNGPADTATFQSSNITNLSLSSGIQVDSIVFNVGASAFTINVNPPAQQFQLFISGAGITNDSGIAQHFVTADDAGGALGEIIFGNSATAGSMTVFINKGGVFGGQPGAGGGMRFTGTSTADHGTFTNNAGAVTGASGGFTFFEIGSTAGDGHFTNDGAAVSGAGAGVVTFFTGSNGGNATIINNGGTATGAAGGRTTFFGGTIGAFKTSAANATLIANGGTNGGSGGVIEFSGRTQTGGKSRVELFGNGTGSTNGTLDISSHNAPGVAIGSLEGSGLVLLGANNLTVGSNKLSTTFSGIISGGSGGSLTKVGTGILVLDNANSYTGGTTIKGGKLVVNNAGGSGTGSGPVQVNRGKLRGKGTIAGDVTVGDGSGLGAVLSPGNQTLTRRTLTLQSTLTFNSDGIYKFGLNSSNVTADRVVALGVTINSGAQFSFTDVGTGTLTSGTVFTVINNTAATPIAGTFSNLADGSTFTSNGNNYKVDYQGGDGNNLTLTVQ